MFNLFRLLEKKILKIFSIWERRKSRHKFGGTKVCKAEEVRKYFVNPKIKIEVFRYIICSLDFQNVSCTLLLLHMKTMNGVVLWYTLLLALTYFVLLRVLRFILFFFFLRFFVSSGTCWGIEVSLVILKIKQWSCLQAPRCSFKGWVVIALFSN